MKRSDIPRRSIRCTVELTDLSGIRAGTARLIDADGIRVHFSPKDGDGLIAGRTLELVSAGAPIGPFSTEARVVSIEPGTDHRGRPIISTSLAFTSLDETQRRELRDRLARVRPVVLTLGLDIIFTDDDVEFRHVPLIGEDDLFTQLDQDDVAVLVLGPGLTAAESHDVLAHCQARFPNIATINIVTGVEAEADRFQDYVDEDRLFYLTRGVVTIDEIRSLVSAAINVYSTRLERARALPGNESVEEGLLEECARLVSQEEVSSVCGLLVECVCRSTGGDWADCLIYDIGKHVLRSPDRPGGQSRVESAVTGLMGYVAITGKSVHLGAMVSDPRYDADVDNPAGVNDGEFFAEPLLADDDFVIGVIAVVRSAPVSTLCREDIQRIRILAKYAASAIRLILLRDQTQASLLDRNQAAGDSELFRQEALDYHRRGGDREGSLLWLSPQWLTVAHALTVLLFLFAIGYLAIARINEYAVGPSIVRARGKIVVAASKGGLVRSVEVLPGSRVRRGDLLVRFDDTAGASSADIMNEQAWAPGDGVVGDIRVRPGQRVSAGEQLASIIDEMAGYDVIAFIPGYYAPQIHPNMQLVLKLEGYPNAHEVVRVDAMAGEVVGPQEAQRYAGADGGPPLALVGSSLPITSHLPFMRFSVDGRTYNYRDGMTGQIELVIGSQPMILSLIPGLRNALRK